MSVCKFHWIIAEKRHRSEYSTAIAQAVTATWCFMVVEWKARRDRHEAATTVVPRAEQEAAQQLVRGTEGLLAET
jgi:hypothetical protein